MILFLDTSALVKLFQSEIGSENVLHWVKSAKNDAFA
jgi:PIN domain nuclease of toxin-antitoxin system